MQNSTKSRLGLLVFFILLVAITMALIPWLISYTEKLQSPDALVWGYIILTNVAFWGLWYRVSVALADVFPKTGPMKFAKGAVSVMTFLVIFWALGYLFSFVLSNPTLTREEQKEMDEWSQCREECQKEADEKDRKICEYGCQ